MNKTQPISLFSRFLIYCLLIGLGFSVLQWLSGMSYSQIPAWKKYLTAGLCGGIGTVITTWIDKARTKRTGA